MKKLLYALILAAFALTSSGCSWLNDSSTPPSPEFIAADAMEDFNTGQYSAALKNFQILRDRFPFSEYSLMAELKTGDCHFYLGQHLEAIAAYQDFEQNHPTNEAIPYTQFQIGMSYYKQLTTIDRDPSAAHLAISTFSRLIRTFPKCPYVQEARARIIAAENFLANHELYVANFYIKTDKLKQAATRLEFLLDNFPTTTAGPRAEELLAILKTGEKPNGSWQDWIPEIGMPDWETFKTIGARQSQ
ncbi:MAG: outer membrane protein assembly factor BamD [Desulfobulbaceae bacterium]|jgi:outer membrane protein assembly factor BamD|nr:outer membrane protein assembly factor BamD [Desulfobulbaceae bacterium]